MKRACILLVAATVLICRPAHGSCGEPNEPGVPRRPRIGLVLSGGAALGSAHVGALKVLEEMRIPVDCLAGTSMGAIVGGLYASGVSPSEMETILATTDWRNLLDDRPPRRHLPYRRKVDDQTYLTRFEAGFNRGSVQIPPGLISGQQLGFALQEMALQAAGIEDFDLLPIPFRAAATDLASGDLVVLRGGDLGQAIRASMSIPGIFSPVVIDGRTLVDGGLARNLPVDLAREMGAEVIIAVDVGQPMEEKQLWSIGSVTGQVMGFQIAANTRAQSKLADVIVRPRLTGFGSAQFERGLEMVPFGEAAARDVAPELERYSLPEGVYRARLERIRRKRSFSDAKVRSIQLTQSSTADSRFVMRQVRIRPGDPLDLEAIRQDLERLYETGDYERIDFRLKPIDHDFELYIEAIDKPWGPNILRLGLNVVADLEGESSFDALTSYTMTRLNRRRGELKVHAQLGENPAISAELYQPLSIHQTWFVSAGARQSTTTEYLQVPAATGAVAPYRFDTGAFELDLGLQLGEYAELRLGLVNGTTLAEIRGGAGAVPPAGLDRELEYDSGGIHASAIVDQFDNMNFPRQGYFVVADYFDSRENLGAEGDYQRLASFVGLAGTHGRHTVLGLSNLYSALGSSSPETFTLGGLFRLSGAPSRSVRGQYGGNVTALYLYRAGDLPLGLGDGIYVGGSVEAGNLWETADDVSASDLRYAGSLVLGADTSFGPLYLAAGFGEGGDQALYLFVGRTF
ncbi:MAG: patatin-like phospholipase family protein [Acidobacteria bacterium]|nr:patatin-like phospholipase family protein [Acidobacteriota bacterium]